MSFIVIVCSLFIAATGAVGLVSPGRFISFVRSWGTQAGFHLITAFRVVLGFALISAAPASRAPFILPAVGVVFITSSLMVLLLGMNRFRVLLEVGIGVGTGGVRAWAGFDLFLGLWLIYAVV